MNTTGTHNRKIDTDFGAYVIKVKRRTRTCIQTTEGVDVTTVILRPRHVVAGVAHGPQPLAVGCAGTKVNRLLNTGVFPGAFDTPHIVRASAAGGSSRSPKVSARKKQRLRIGRVFNAGK